MTSRFDFLTPLTYLPSEVQTSAQEAESHARNGHYDAALNATRRALEYIVAFYWQKMQLPAIQKGVEVANPFYNSRATGSSNPNAWQTLKLDSLFSQIYILEKENVWQREQAERAHFIRKNGNKGSHGGEVPATASEVNEALQDLEKIAQQWEADFPTGNSPFRTAQAFRSAAVAPTSGSHRPKLSSRSLKTGVVAAVVGVIVFRGLFALFSFNSSRHAEPPPAASATMQPENTLRYPNGDIFEGNVINGQANDPNGKITRANGTVCIGNVIADKLNGIATCTAPNGDAYQGDYQDDLRHGKGAFTFDGNRYEGAFANDLMQGEGTLTAATGNRYQGAFRNNEPAGNGKIIFADQSECIGTFDAQTARCDLSNGNHYAGAYQPATLYLEGKGVLTDGEGNVLFDGAFVQNQPQGKVLDATQAQAEALQKRAEQGDADAQTTLGVDEAEQGNYGNAYKWLTRAAEANHAEAQYYLAIMYERGLGISKNVDEAHRWYQRAADNGYAKAQKRIADIKQADDALANPSDNGSRSGKGGSDDAINALFD